MSYFMGCIVLVRCVLVLRCGLAGVVWYLYAGFSLHMDTTLPAPTEHPPAPFFQKMLAAALSCSNL